MTDDEGDIPTAELPIPDGYDEASYRAGYARAMEQIGTAAFDGAAAIAPADGPLADDEADDEETCPECGAPMIAALGGHVCVECNDTHE